MSDLYLAQHKKETAIQTQTKNPTAKEIKPRTKR